MIIIKWANYWT